MNEYGNLYTRYNKDSFMALMYMFFFFMRRLLLAILAVWSSESTMF